MQLFFAVFSVIGAFLLIGMAFISTNASNLIVGAFVLFLFAIFLGVWRIGDILEKRFKQ